MASLIHKDGTLQQKNPLAQDTSQKKRVPSSFSTSYAKDLINTLISNGHYKKWPEDQTLNVILDDLERVAKRIGSIQDEC